MAITVAETNNVLVTAGTTYALPLSGPIAAGDVLVLVVAGNLNSAAITLPAGWALLISQAEVSLAQYQARIYYRIAAGGEATTIGSFTTTGSSTLAAVIYRLVGCRQLAPSGLEIAGHAGRTAGPVCPCGTVISTGAGLAIAVALGDLAANWDNPPFATARFNGNTTALDVAIADAPVAATNTAVLGEAYMNSANKQPNNCGASVFIGDNAWLDSPRVIAPTTGAGMVKRFDPRDPAEVLDYDVDLTALLGAGESVATWTPAVSPVGGSLVLGAAQSKAGNARWKQWVSGGTSLTTYHVTVLALTTLGRRLEVDLVIPCVTR